MAATGTLFKYTPAERDHGLLVIASVGGNCAKASRILKANGTPIPQDTLYEWKARQHRDRYLELAAKHGREIEEAAVVAMRETILQAGEVERVGLEKAYDQVEAGDAKDPSAVARNAAVVKGINTQHLLTLTGRPSSITETRSVEEIVRGLERLGVVESTAEEVEQAELPEGPAVLAPTDAHEEQTPE